MENDRCLLRRIDYCRPLVSVADVAEMLKHHHFSSHTSNSNLRYEMKSGGGFFFLRGGDDDHIYVRESVKMDPHVWEEAG